MYTWVFSSSNYNDIALIFWHPSNVHNWKCEKLILPQFTMVNTKVYRDIIDGLDALLYTRFFRRVFICT